MSPDRLRVDILPSDTTPFVNSLDKVSAWPGARCAVVQGGISHDFGRVSIAMAHDVAATTLIPRAPKGREEVPVQISRLLHAHEIVLKEARTMARLAAEGGDDGTNDLLVSDVIRSNELQVWFIAEHVVDVPLARAV